MWDEVSEEERIATTKVLEIAKAKINLVLAEHGCTLISADEWHEVLLSKYAGGTYITVGMK